MTNSRDHVLATIRKSLLQTGHLPTGTRAPLTPEAVGEREAMLAQFALELGQVGGVCERERAGESAVAARVIELAHGAGADDVLAWDQAYLPVPGLLDAVRAAGLRVLDGHLPHAEPARTAAVAALETCRVGLTGADAAFAETGTLAVRSGPGRSRLASLSVALHIAVVTPEQFWASWAGWWQAHTDPAAPGGREWMQGASNLTLITGPSRTGDIEMTLTVGMHGPRTVHVIIVG